MLKELAHSVVHLFYPRLCMGCNKPLLSAEDVLCFSCALHLPQTGYHHIQDNETGLRFAGRVPYIHATTFAYFTNEGLLQHLLHELKYKDRKDVGEYLGRQFAQDLQATSWIADIDMIVPVPLHPKKEAKRGYNQSTLIAEGMAVVLHIPVQDKILLRARHTESQTQKTRAERVKNMEGAFVVKSPAALKNKHILLIDDVLTTGATLEACANALMAAGNVKVSIATIGIAVS